MLVLTLFKEGILYLDGGRIALYVVECRPDRVRIGVVAEREVSIDRQEVFDSKVDDGTVKDCRPPCVVKHVNKVSKKRC